MSYDESRDGLWKCFKCEEGNLFQLRELLGDKQRGVTSMQDVARSQRSPEPLPDVEAAHRRLMAEAENPDVERPALDYLVSRGFSIAMIEKHRIGVESKFGRRWILYPYLNKGTPVYVKFRSIPPGDKEFRGISGREQPLFNGDALQPGLEDIILCEGEADCLSLLSHGIDNVVGVPGSTGRKISWIDALDKANPKRVYLAYDNDDAGAKGARELAKRIGLEKVYNIELPPFTFEEEGETKQGKDVGEYLQAYGIEAFLLLKEEAKQYPVDGVVSVGDVIKDIKSRLTQGESLKPRYYTQWPSVNRIVGGFEDGDLIGLIAEAKQGKTTVALNMLDFLTSEFKQPGFFFCLEMAPDRLVTKFCQMVTGASEVTEEVVDSALDIALTREADLLFGYTRNAKYQDVFDVIRQTVRRFGVKFVVFDNLQILFKSLEHSHQEASVIMAGFKDLCLELGIVLILIVQPHRVAEGHIVSARNASGSSSIEKFVDSMLCIHRNRQGKVDAEDFGSSGYFEVSENFAPEMLIRADLTRYAQGGATTLLFDGATSRVSEFSAAAVEQRRSNAVSVAVDIVNRVHAPQFFESA